LALKIILFIVGITIVWTGLASGFFVPLAFVCLLVALVQLFRGTRGKIVNPTLWFGRGTDKLRLELSPLGTTVLVGSVALLFGLIAGTLLALIAFAIGSA
jgi:hypothetical protein